MPYIITYMASIHRSITISKRVATFCLHHVLPSVPIGTLPWRHCEKPLRPQGQRGIKLYSFICIGWGIIFRFQLLQGFFQFLQKGYSCQCHVLHNRKALISDIKPDDRIPEDGGICAQCPIKQGCHQHEQHRIKPSKPPGDCAANGCQGSLILLKFSLLYYYWIMGTL